MNARSSRKTFSRLSAITMTAFAAHHNVVEKFEREANKPIVFKEL